MIMGNQINIFAAYRPPPVVEKRYRFIFDLASEVGIDIWECVAENEKAAWRKLELHIPGAEDSVKRVLLVDSVRIFN